MQSKHLYFDGLYTLPGIETQPYLPDLNSNRLVFAGVFKWAFLKLVFVLSGVLCACLLQI